MRILILSSILFFSGCVSLNTAREMERAAHYEGLFKGMDIGFASGAANQRLHDLTERQRAHLQDACGCNRFEEAAKRAFDETNRELRDQEEKLLRRTR